MKSDGSLRQWTNGNLHALLEPTPTGHRLRLGTVKGNARAWMATGLTTVGISAAVSLSAAVGGDLTGAMAGIGFLLAAGLGMFANGALRLPSWARLRARQMEGIAERLALPPEPQPPHPPALPGD